LPSSARKDAYRFKLGDESCQVDLSPVTHVAKEKGIPPFLVRHVADWLTPRSRQFRKFTYEK
jgi:hypothetical protein